MLGIIGQLIIIGSLVAVTVSGLAYFFAARNEGLASAQGWSRIGKGGWIISTVLVTVASIILSYLIFSHQFQYAYVYQQSSRDLPAYFLLSAFWAGQEGSFLLWIVMMGALGLMLIRWAGEYRDHVMTAIALCQFFLIAMIVGLQFGSLAIGASPFTTIYEKFPGTALSLIPADGSGLNDLLQNYWMAIHPPTLFAGFTAMAAPFAFAVAALWRRKYTEWVRPALPWALAACMILGVGIAMGGYWAYETLSFGGYWAWDPVENSSLVPWIVGVASLHMMIVQKKSSASHKSALFLSILAFMLVVYSTFLTRSGVLGDVSVHSFVDLGLYSQLVVWIGTMGIVGFGLFIFRYRELPVPDKEPEMLSREFMIFSGALLLFSISLVILLGTSSPLLGKLFRSDPSAVPISFYNTWSLPITIGFMFLIGMGQLFWWHKMKTEQLNRVLLKPFALAVISTILILIFTPFAEKTATPQATPDMMQASFFAVYGTGIQLLLLLFVTFFALFGNGIVLWRIGRGNPKLAGGAVTHIGFAIMILGVIASSAFDNPLTDANALAGRPNFVLNKGETKTVEGYTVTYNGTEPNDRGRDQYVLDIVAPTGYAFTVKPVVYKSNKDQWIQHPDVRVGLNRDLFVAVTPQAMLAGNTPTSSQGGELTLARGEDRMLGNNEYELIFRDYDINVESDLIPQDSTEIAVAAVLELTRLATGETRELRPIYLVLKDGRQQFIQNRLSDWNLTVTFSGMNVNARTANFIFDGVAVDNNEWIVIQAYEKPLINLVWIGIIMLSFGFGIAMVRRIQDVTSARN